MPSTAAIRVERIMTFAPLTGCRIRTPGSRCFSDCSSARQKGLGFTDFQPVGISVLG